MFQEKPLRIIFLKEAIEKSPEIVVFPGILYTILQEFDEFRD